MNRTGRTILAGFGVLLMIPGAVSLWFMLSDIAGLVDKYEAGYQMPGWAVLVLWLGLLVVAVGGALIVRTAWTMD